MKKFYILLVAAILLCTACSSENNHESMESRLELTTEQIEETAKDSTRLDSIPEETASEPTVVEETSGESTTPVTEVANSEKQVRRSYSRTDMDWIDVYIYIINTINTRRIDSDGSEIPGTPVFTLLRYNNSDVPVLLTGYLDSNGSDRITVYSNTDGYLYDSGTFRGTLYKKEDEKRFCIQLSNGMIDKYRYENQTLYLEEQIDSLPEGYIPVTYTTLEDNVITAENISSFIQ